MPNCEGDGDKNGKSWESGEKTVLKIPPNKENLVASFGKLVTKGQTWSF